jgi:glycerol-3-phosphate dehydrogenase
MALAASRSGRRPMVVERGQPGSGASGNSYGIVHGGLRYLQTLDVARWRRSRSAQAWFLSRYPTFVLPLACIMPLYRRRLRSPAAFRTVAAMELLLEKATGMERPLPPLRIISPKDVASAYPVPTDGLTGAAVWHDAQIGDVTRLIERVLLDAGVSSDSLRLSTEACELVVRNNRVAGVRLRDQRDRTLFEIETDMVIDCTGSWSRTWRPTATSPSTAVLAFNLILDVPFPGDSALAVSASPGRGSSYFLRPQGSRTFVGTYYRPAPGAHEPIVEDRDIKAFLTSLDATLPGMSLASAPIHKVLAGLLPDTDGTGRYLRAVDHVSSGSPEGYHRLLGAKLTTAPLLSFDVAAKLWGTDLAA